MKHNVRAVCLAIGLAVANPVSAQQPADELTVFAAASLATAMDQIEQAFEAETGMALTVSLAGSSVLARQIQMGAPADIFISANSAWMDHLERAGLVEPGTRHDLLRNSLVLIAPQGTAPIDLSDLPDALGQGRLAMALVEAVPAGIYGKAALTDLDLWQALAPRVAQADNVRAALALVAAGAAPFGVVYATDALAEPRVTVVARFDPASHAPIVYPVADLATRDTKAEAAFLAFLASPQAQAIFAAQGFDVIGKDD